MCNNKTGNQKYFCKICINFSKMAKIFSIPVDIMVRSEYNISKRRKDYVNRF